MTDCGSIQERLSAYIDEALSSKEKAVVDEHLKTCRECTATLADMKKVIEHIKGLETVEPPVWMKQKIMAKVRAEAQPKKSLFQKLFYPLHIKLPIEAVATVLVVGLALYIYRDIAPEMKLAQAPVEEVAPQIFQKEQQPAQKEAEAHKVTPSSPSLPPPSPPIAKRGKAELETRKSASARPSEESKKVLPVSPSLTPPVLPSGKGVLAGKTAPAPERLAEEPTSSKEPESMRERFAAIPKAPEPMKQAESTQGAEAPAQAKKREQAPAAGALAKDEAHRVARPATPEAKLSYMEKKKEEMLTLSVLVKDPEAAVKEIEKTLKELEGKAVRVESSDGKKVISAVLKTSRLHKLSGKLKVIGEIREKELDVGGREGQVNIRIEVIENPH